MKKKLFSVLFFTGLVFCVSAETTKTLPKSEIHSLTVDKAVEMAIQNNISIKQSKLQLENLERQDKYSWNSVSPSFSLGAKLNDSFSPVAASDENGKPKKDENGNIIYLSNYKMEYSISTGISLHFSPSLFTTMKAAKLAYENGEISYETAKRNVELNVRQSFYSLLASKESLESNQKAVDGAKRTYETNLEKYNRGQMDQLSLLTSQYNYERQLPAIQSARNSYNLSIDNFKQVLGINLLDDIVLEGSLDDILNVKLDEEIIQVELEELPSVKSVLQSIKSAENSLQATKFSAYGPSISASYSYYLGGGIKPQSDLKATNNSLSVNVSIPVDGYLPWSNGSLSIQTQKMNLENLKLQLENAKTTAVINIRNYYNTINNAQAQLKILESNLELMQKTYDMTLIAYNNGSKDLNTLQTAEDNLASARYSVQNQKNIIVGSVLTLENLLGIPFGTLGK